MTTYHVIIKTSDDTITNPATVTAYHTLIARAVRHALGNSIDIELEHGQYSGPGVIVTADDNSDTEFMRAGIANIVEVVFNNGGFWK